jgi:hypothetical protein
MRRKRLNHCADIVCDMFCGWRLMNSYEDLVRLGSGPLVINLLTDDCIFNGQPTHTLTIACELSTWFREDLAKHRIPLAAITEAKLDAELKMETRSAVASRGSYYIGKDGKPIEKGDFHTLAARLHSTIATDEASYERSRSHYESWPVGWPYV